MSAHTDDRAGATRLFFLLVAAAVTVVAAVLVVLFALGSFTATVQAPQEVVAGTLDLCGPENNECTVTAASEVDDMLPGESVQSFFVLRNTGTLASSDVVASVTPAGKDASVGSVFRVTLQRCAGSFSRVDARDCTSWASPLSSWGSVAPPVAATSAGSGLLQAGGGEVAYRVTLLLPVDAPQLAQGQELRFDWNFTAVPRSPTGDL